MKYLVLILTFAGLVGCASFDNLQSTGLVVQYATLKFVGKAEPGKRIIRAQKIIKHASQAKVLFDQDKLPIEQIEELVRRRIDWTKLDPADTLLLDALIKTVVIEVNQNTGRTKPGELTTGSAVLDWIIKGAQLAGA